MNTAGQHDNFVQEPKQSSCFGTIGMAKQQSDWQQSDLAAVSTQIATLLWRSLPPLMFAGCPGSLQFCG